MNKKPLSVIDLYSLITCMLMVLPCYDSDLIDSTRVYKWRRMTWWAQSNQGHKRLWISTPPERCSRHCDATHCDSLNYGISCGNGESRLPHGASNTCTRSAEALNSRANDVKLTVERFYFRDWGADHRKMRFNWSRVANCCVCADVTHASFLCHQPWVVPVCVKTKLSHHIVFTAAQRLRPEHY